MNRPFNIPIVLPRGPEHLWSVIRAAGVEGITLPDLAGCTNGMAFTTTKTYLTHLRKIGAVVPVGTAPARSHRSIDPVRYAVSEAFAKTREAPVHRRDDYTGQRGRVQQQVWNAMRQMRDGFSLPELALAASTPDLEVKVRTAETYVRGLLRADLVVATRPYAKGAKGRKPGASAGRYRLKPSANTGPKPLKLFQARAVFDPNLKKLVGTTQADEVSA